MAIPTNYAELQTEIANWLKRNDLTNDIPGFISLAEQRINNEDAIIFQEATSNITTTIGQDFTALPSGFKEVRSLTYTTSNFENPTKVDLASLENYRNVNISGVPRFFAISKSNFEWDVLATSAFNMTCKYYKEWDIAADNTNFLLTNYYGVYLFAALEEAAIFIRHPQLVVWERKAQKSIDRLRRNSAVREKAPLAIDPALVTQHGTYNINSGY
jgi:hypothetical protein